MNNNKKPLISDDTKKILIRFLLSLPLPGSELYVLVDDLKRSRDSIDDKITKASSALQETSQLMRELEQSLEERTEKLSYLRREVERYSQLAEVGEDKAKALIQQLELSLSKGRNTERWVSLLINLIAGLLIFALGVVFGPVISRWLGVGG